MLKENEELEQLSLRNCGLKYDDVEKIDDALLESGCPLKLLNLNCNKLTSGSAKHVVDLINEKEEAVAQLKAAFKELVGKPQNQYEDASAKMWTSKPGFMR